ncbi:MAG: hypothetical protein ACOH5I_24175 [Oligoflexus sp.]
MDHGIETADVRRSMDKQESGNICLTLRNMNSGFERLFWDDGAGIDLNAV